MSDYYPPVSFFFQVLFSGETTAISNGFQEVSGLSMDLDIEEVKEGGENRFKYRLPSPTKYQNLLLKRGLIPKNSSLAKWCEETINGEIKSTIKPKDLVVQLIDGDKKVLKSWTFYNTYPVKWIISGLKSEANELVIESLELAYTYFSSK